MAEVTPEGLLRRRTGDMQQQLGFRFPGRPVASLRAGPNEVRSCVTAYGRAQCDLQTEVTRWNLFGELDGSRQHFATAFATGQFDGLLFSVSGHLADSWHLYAQATSDRVFARGGLLSSDCCAEPSVQVPPERLVIPNAPPGFSLNDYVAGFVAPQVSPVQPNRGQVQPLSYFSAAGANTVLVVLDGIASGRVLWWQAVGLDATATVAFAAPGWPSATYPIGTAAAQQAPEGNLICSSVELTKCVFFAATVVR